MNTEKAPGAGGAVPLTRSLTGGYAATFIIASLMTAMSIAGLLASHGLYRTEEMRVGFVATDMVNLALVAPLLLWGCVRARRGSLVGYVVWIGSLLVVNYHSIAYAVANPMMWQSVAYVTLVGLTAWALSLLIGRIDLPEIRRRLDGAVPERCTGAVLIVLGLLFLLRAGSSIIGALGAGEALPPTECADFLVSLLWIIGGAILWQKKALGYILGAGLIVQASMLFGGLLLYFLVLPIVSNTPFPLEDFIVIFLMGWVCYIPLGLYIRGIHKRSRGAKHSGDTAPMA
jgi:hypothetical protein